jgi:hypothetical protein
MTNLKYLSVANNILENAVITASTVNATYPAANLTDLTTVAKTTRTTSPTSQNYAVDLGSALGSSLITLFTHNLTSAASIVLRGGSVPNPDGSQFEETIPWREFDIFHEFDTETWRYWDLRVTDPSNPAGYLEFGGWLMGAIGELSANFDWNSGLDHDTKVTRQMTPGGVRHAAIQYKRKVFSMKFGQLTIAETSEIVTLFDALDMDCTPIFLIPYPERRADEGYLVQLTSPLRESRGPAVSIPTLTFEQLSRGLSA